MLRAAQAGGGRSARGAGAVRAVRPDGPPPRLERHPTDREEAWAIARAVRDRRAPRTPWSAQAVLVRTNAQIPLIAEAFRGAGGIPHRVRGGNGDLPAANETNFSA